MTDGHGEKEQCNIMEMCVGNVGGYVVRIIERGESKFHEY